MGVSQPHVAQVEARDDVYFSTLIYYVRALGSDPRIEAAFPAEKPVAVTLAQCPMNRDRRRRALQRKEPARPENRHFRGR
jgi:hypothetical protein